MIAENAGIQTIKLFLIKYTNKGLKMNNFDRYLSDINSEMLQDIAKKRRLKNTIMDVLGGFILFSILGFISYFILSLPI